MTYYHCDHRKRSGVRRSGRRQGRCGTVCRRGPGDQGAEELVKPGNAVETGGTLLRIVSTLMLGTAIVAGRERILSATRFFFFCHLWIGTGTAGRTTRGGATSNKRKREDERQKEEFSQYFLRHTMLFETRKISERIWQRLGDHGRN